VAKLGRHQDGDFDHDAAVPSAYDERMSTSPSPSTSAVVVEVTVAISKPISAVGVSRAKMFCSAYRGREGGR